MYNIQFFYVLHFYHVVFDRCLYSKSSNVQVITYLFTLYHNILNENIFFVIFVISTCSICIFYNINILRYVHKIYILL